MCKPTVGECYSIELDDGQHTLYVDDVRELYCTCKLDNGNRFDISIDSFFTQNKLTKLTK